jgi:predicted AAA+ superfamily ATPase
MKYVVRKTERDLLRASRHFSAVILADPRRAVKTTLLRYVFPKATHAMMEDPDLVSRARSAQNAFLNESRIPVILDEIQNTPGLFNHSFQ